MIAPNENGRATETRSVTPPVVIATAGRGAVNHYLEDSPYLESMEGVNRIRAMEGYDARREFYTGGDCTDLFDGEPGSFVDARLDGEPRDGMEGYSNDN